MIVDEVGFIDKVLVDMLVVVEVVVFGKVIEIIFNLYGIVIVFYLNLDEMKNIIFVVWVLIGNCLVVVIKMLEGDVKVWIILVGYIEF